MQQFSHDYTKVSEAMESLYSATRLIANDCYDAALQRINEARTTLDEYLAQDNMIPDNDLADGWVRHSEAQAELEALRSRVGDTPRSAPDGSSVGAAASPSPQVERHGQIDSRYLTQQTDGADPSNPLYGKVAVLSGTFEQIHMERDQVAAAIQRLGAKLNRSVSATMQVFVAGDKVGPAKFKQVESLRAEGHNIRIISQLEFKEICNQYLKQ